MTRVLTALIVISSVVICSAETPKFPAITFDSADAERKHEAIRARVRNGELPRLPIPLIMKNMVSP